jgi:hypothetical protein
MEPGEGHPAAMEDGAMPNKKGARGERGVRGPAGPTGPVGERGRIGATGSRGSTGQTGARGSDGATGARGARGAIGAVGPEETVGGRARVRLLADVDQHISHIYNELNLQIKRTGQIQVELDDLRSKLMKLMGSAG